MRKAVHKAWQISIAEKEGAAMLSLLHNQIIRSDNQKLLTIIIKRILPQFGYVFLPFLVS